MNATKPQIGFIKGLAKSHGMEISAKELEGYSYQEADKLIKSLRGTQKQVTPEDKMKKKIISMAMTIGWVLKNGKIDMVRLNTWCVHKGMYKLSLDMHDPEQLPYLVSQFQYGPFQHALSKKKHA